MKNLKTFNEFVNEKFYSGDNFEKDLEKIFDEFDKKLENKNLFNKYDDETLNYFNEEYSNLKNEITNPNIKYVNLEKIFGLFISGTIKTVLNTKGINIVIDLKKALQELLYGDKK